MSRSSRTITSKRSKTVKGEYDIYKGKKKIGVIFQGESDTGKWISLITDKKLYEIGNKTDSGTSAGSKTKSKALDWFFEWWY